MSISYLGFKTDTLVLKIQKRVLNGYFLKYILMSLSLFHLISPTLFFSSSSNTCLALANIDWCRQLDHWCSTAPIYQLVGRPSFLLSRFFLLWKNFYIYPLFISLIIEHINKGYINLFYRTTLFLNTTVLTIIERRQFGNFSILDST